MFNNTKFFIFANQKGLSNLFPSGTATTLYRDFINDPQLNGPASTYRVGPNLTYFRNSYGTYFDSLCTIKVASNNEPRFNYSPQGVYKGLLIEKSTTNFIPYSTDFEQNTWSKPLTANSASFGVTLTSNVPGLSAPDDTETVTCLANTSAFGYHVISWGELPVPPNEEIELANFYDRSIFVKKNTARYLCVSVSPAPSAESITSIFDFDQANFISESTLGTYVIPVKNDWYRIGFNRLTTNTNTNHFTIGIAKGPLWTDAAYETEEAGLSSVYIWGAQAELGLYPTSYIPSNGAQTTRAADNISVTGRNFSLMYNPTASSFFVQGDKNFNLDYEAFATYIKALSSPIWSSENTPIYRELLFDNNTPRNTLGTFTNNISSKYWSVGAFLSTNRFTLTNTSMESAINSDIVNEKNFSVAVGLQENDFVLYHNQALSGQETLGTLPQAPLRPIQFQLGRFINFNYMDGHVQKFGYWPTRLNNQALSSL